MGLTDHAAQQHQWNIEDCARLHVQRELFKIGLVTFNGASAGVWRGRRWTVVLSPSGSLLEICGRRWELVPHPSSSSINGVRWYVLGSDGRRVTSLFLTPDGRIGTRWELGLTYRSQRLWTKRRLAWARQKVIERLDGPTDFEWVRDHPGHLPRKPKWMKQARYRKLRRKLVLQAQSHGDELVTEKLSGEISTEKRLHAFLHGLARAVGGNSGNEIDPRDQVFGTIKRDLQKTLGHLFDYPNWSQGATCQTSGSILAGPSHRYSI